MAIMDRLRHMPRPTPAEVNGDGDSDGGGDDTVSEERGVGQGRKNVVACAFGPGMNVEMCVLRRKDGVT